MIIFLGDTGGETNADDTNMLLNRTILSVPFYSSTKLFLSIHPPTQQSNWELH